MIVARENESESLREARLTTDVERVIVGRESESLREALRDVVAQREAISAADV